MKTTYSIEVLEQVKSAFIRDEVRFFIDQVIEHNGSTHWMMKAEIEDLKLYVKYAKEKGYLRKRVMESPDSDFCDSRR
jgi:hypothetical protein